RTVAAAGADDAVRTGRPDDAALVTEAFPAARTAPRLAGADARVDRTLPPEARIRSGAGPIENLAPAPMAMGAAAENTAWRRSAPMRKLTRAGSPMRRSSTKVQRAPGGV